MAKRTVHFASQRFTGYRGGLKLPIGRENPVTKLRIQKCEMSFKNKKIEHGSTSSESEKAEGLN